MSQWNKHSTYCTILVNKAHPIHKLTVCLTLQDTTEIPHTSGQLFQKILLHVDIFPLEYFQPFLELRYLNFPPVPFFWFLQDIKQCYVIITGSSWLVKVNLIFIHPRRKLFWFICKSYVKVIVVRSFRLASANLIFINPTKSSENHTICYSKLYISRHVQCHRRKVLHFIYATLQHTTLSQTFRIRLSLIYDLRDRCKLLLETRSCGATGGMDNVTGTDRLVTVMVRWLCHGP